MVSNEEVFGNYTGITKLTSDCSLATVLHNIVVFQGPMEPVNPVELQSSEIKRVACHIFTLI